MNADTDSALEDELTDPARPDELRYLAELRRLRDAARAELDRRETTIALEVARLRSRGVPRAPIALVLDVTESRVSQLAQEAEEHEDE